jgi:hypothetical protein
MTESLKFLCHLLLETHVFQVTVSFDTRFVFLLPYVLHYKNKHLYHLNASGTPDLQCVDSNNDCRLTC